MSPLASLLNTTEEVVDGVTLKARNVEAPLTELQSLDTYMANLGYTAEQRAQVVSDDKLRREVATSLILVQRVAPKAV